MLLCHRALALAARRTMASAAAAGGGSSGGAPAAAGAAVKLDRDAFKRVVTVPALRIPKTRCNELMKTFRG
jgi:hypothetical protein